MDKHRNLNNIIYYTPPIIIQWGNTIILICAIICFLILKNITHEETFITKFHINNINNKTIIGNIITNKPLTTFKKEVIIQKMKNKKSPIYVKGELTKVIKNNNFSYSLTIRQINIKSNNSKFLNKKENSILIKGQEKPLLNYIINL